MNSVPDKVVKSMARSFADWARYFGFLLPWRETLRGLSWFSKKIVDQAFVFATRSWVFSKAVLSSGRR